MVKNGKSQRGAGKQAGASDDDDSASPAHQRDPEIPYCRQYVLAALRGESLDPPDPEQAGRYREALDSLYDDYQDKANIRECWQVIVRSWPELADLAREPPRKLYHADELDSLPTPCWLIQDEIPEHGLTVLFGPSGSGKSFVTLDYAPRISQSKPVIYIAAEDASGYNARYKAWKQHHNCVSAMLYF